MKLKIGMRWCLLATCPFILASCSDSDYCPPDLSAKESPPVNSFLADSVAPIAHVNSAQTDSVAHAGPAGPTERLDEMSGGLSYQHLGPAHFGIAISPRYPDMKSRALEQWR